MPDACTPSARATAMCGCEHLKCGWSTLGGRVCAVGDTREFKVNFVALALFVLGSAALGAASFNFCLVSVDPGAF